MVDKAKIVLFVMFFLLFLGFSKHASGAVCRLPPLYTSATDDTSLGLQEGPMFANMFLCPPNPDDPNFPVRPSELSYGPGGDFYGGIAKYSDTFADIGQYNERALRESDEEADYSITFQTDGICYQGAEGQYFVWYQVDDSPSYYDAPSEGFCYGPVHTVDWDTEQYCNSDCVGHTVFWDDELSCCGDDESPDSSDSDCLMGNSEKICVKVGERWHYLDTEDEDQIGNTKELSCADASIVSDGNNILRCGGGNLPETGTTDEMEGAAYITRAEETRAYLCFTDMDGLQKIAECVGEGSDWSRDGGITKDYGGSVNGLEAGEEVIYYCTLHREGNENPTEWKKDLDTLEPINSEDCSNALLPNGDPAGYRWTGTKCCSEADDENEFYNDKEGFNISNPYSGGCWDSENVPAGTKLPNRALADVINYKGGFEGCSLDEDNQFLDILDSHTGEPLVNNNEYCQVLVDARGAGDHVFCSFSGNWVETDFTETVMKTAPWNDTTGCCSPTQCWTGEECVDDQSGSSKPITYNDDYRCINGEWTDEIPVKFTPDGKDFGYCPSTTQCLVNPSEFAERNCIDAGEYYGENFCENGEWNSRTRLLAVAFMRYANLRSPEEYTLFCDSYENILNFYNYQAGGDFVLNYVSNCQQGNCVNDFCVLKYDSKVAFGTSVNEPINSQKSFLKALEQSNDLCDNAMDDDNQFHRCGSSNIWYNHRQGAVIKLPDDSNFGSVSWTESIITFIKNPFETIKDWIVPRSRGLEFLNQTNMFTKVYVNVNRDKKIFAFLEQGRTIYVDGWPMNNVDYLGLEYEGIGVNACNLIRNYDPSISCASDQKIFAQSRRPGQRNLVDAWPDLTAKLRVR